MRGGGFRMGSVGFYPEERPVVEAEVGDQLVDEYLVTNAGYRPVREGHQVGDGRGAVTIGGGLPGCKAGAAGARLAGVHPNTRAGAAG